MIRMALIGCGKIADVEHLPAFSSMPEVTLAALADIDAKHLAAAGDKYNVAARYKDYREMLKREEIDAVSICTPNYLHARMTVDCCRAGKHVIVEKPAATSVAEVKRMKAAGEEAGVIIMVEQYHRFIGVNEKARDIVRSGMLGKVIGFRARVGAADPERWSPTSKWFFKKEEAFGGALADIGVHIIDTLRWVSGKEIARVQGFTTSVHGKGDVEDTAALTCETTDGLVGVIEAAWTQWPNYVNYQIYCENGMLENTNYKTLRAVMSEPRAEISFDIPKGSVHGSPFRYFVDCILKGETPFVDIEEGGRSLAVVCAGYRSATTGKAVKVGL